MKLRYRYPSDLTAKNCNELATNRKEYVKALASRYFRLQHGKSILLKKQKEYNNDQQNQDILTLQLWKNHNKIRKQEAMLLATIKNKSDFYSALQGVYDDYKNHEVKLKESLLKNHIMYAIIMFQIFLNGIIVYCKELSAKVAIFIGGAGVFTIFAGMSSFLDSLHKNKDYKLLETTYNRTIEKFTEIFKDRGFI
ncbi:MAG: hypothetical protein QXS93_00910 [Candidatus Micrarchaeia archaeon]